MPETRAEQIARWEREGWLDPNCAGCADFYHSAAKPENVFAPRHALRSCCGQRHGTCPVCWG